MHSQNIKCQFNTNASIDNLVSVGYCECEGRAFFSPPVEKATGSTVTETLSELLCPAVSITVS